MDNNKKYLDYDGLQRYHSNLVNNLKDLVYDPKQMFNDKKELVSAANWGDDRNSQGYVFGLKQGLLVTVGNSVWQLTDPDKFMGILNTIEDVSTKSNKTPTELGWKIVGNTTDFEIDGHILNLVK